MKSKKNLIITFCLFVTTLTIAQQENSKDWFEFQPTTNMTNSVIKMDHWLDKPAGKHGYLSQHDENLQFDNGIPIKFWGVNISAWDVFSTHEKVDIWSETLANYGVNAVRFHKFSEIGMKDSTSTQMKAEKYEKMDYFSANLKEKGIYYGWSPIYGHQPKINDSIELVAYNEITSVTDIGHLSKSTIGLVNFAEDLQDLHISLFINLLNHINSYTGIRNADDPALIFIEIQNEDDIFFATNEKMIERCPSYKELLTGKFHQWLYDKYGNDNNLKKAWGSKAYEWGIEIKNIKWHLDSMNITPVASHGIYNYEYIKALKLDQALPLFLSDMATFLYEQQSEYYKKVKKAIRSTGYKGQIISSNWQAGSGITHYYNLHTDKETGIIDRHNYYGGGTGHTLKAGNMYNDAMVSSPGAGLLSTGMQQVSGAAFSISEWLSLIPNEWTAEASPIIAAYGMGLQGWDASFAFGSEYPTFTPALQQPNKHWPGIYNVMSPTQLSLYPALARMLYRRDIKEGETVSTRYVSLTDLEKGEVGFGEIIEQEGDVKEFNGLIPREALTIGKVVVKFSDHPTITKAPDLSKYWNKNSKSIWSTTGQLNWNYKKKGYFTINSNGTKGIIGFTDCKKINLDGINLSTKNKFAVILISSLDKAKGIKESKNLLVTTMARAYNTDMKYDKEMTKLLDPGTGPIVLEPVSVDLSFDSRTIKSVHILDHSGNRTGKTITNKSKRVFIDGNKTKSIYYEIIFE